MSYSYSARAATKALAKAAVVAELDKVVTSQPIHAKDKALAQAAADSAIDLLKDDESKDIAVSANGYVSYDTTTEELSTVSVSVTASLTTKAV